jgi:xanthine dehydrogenase accessory factor
MVGMVAGSDVAVAMSTDDATLHHMLHPDWLREVHEAGRAAAICTVVATKGSTPRKAGASMLVVDDGSALGAIRGTIGGGAVEHEIRRRALEVIATTRPALVEIPLTTVLGMCCGGTMTLFIESLRMRPPCILFGAGHVGEALARAAALAGFDVSVVDPRDELCTAGRFPDAARFDSYDHDDDLDALPFSADAFVVIATHDHQTDQRLAERVLSRPARYVGLVGSQRKAALTRERCRNKGLGDDVIARLRCPAGLDIGAETPEEIALSIVAQMVQVRRREEATHRRTRGDIVTAADERAG